MRDNYGAWRIGPWDFPKDGTTEDKIRYFVRYGILSANIHNTQPWKFKIEMGKHHTDGFRS